MKLFGRELRLGDPGVAEIVIFDDVNSHVVRQALPAGRTVAILKVRPEDVRLGPRTLFHTARLLLCRLSIAEARQHPHGVARGLLFQCRCIYLEACLAAIAPRAVVTFIDNSGPWGWLSRHCRRFPFFAIQNGTRLSYASADRATYYCQHLFCFGSHETEHFPSLGYRVEQFHPVGSLLASLSFAPAAASAEQYDLLVVSTWRGNIGFGQDVQDTMRSMRVMDERLAEYIRARRLKAAVILRAERGAQHWRMAELDATEEDYYREVYGDAIAILDTDFVTRNVFPLMQRSRVIVSCLSTALLEAFGIGKKVLYCNFTGTDRYHDHLAPDLVTTESERGPFFARLDELRRMPDDEYARRFRPLQRHYMSNPAEPTYRAIATTIDAVIAGVAGR